MIMSKRLIILILLLVSIFNIIDNTPPCSANGELVSAPLLTDSAGHAGQKATSTVFRVFCPKQDRMGTGFLHKSGNILTAAHVVSKCNPADIFVILPQGTKISIKEIVTDDDIDIAYLTPTQVIEGEALPITNKLSFAIGAQVSTWGFPSGYTGVMPMLSVGYLSGRDAIKSQSGKIVERFVVNAAFNSGNSGGPLIDIESKTVIGMVSSKLAPIPPFIKQALNALAGVNFGVTFDLTSPDGTKSKMSQSQLLEKILQYMRSQTQLVVGRAVLPEHIRTFLKKHGLEK